MDDLKVVENQPLADGLSYSIFEHTKNIGNRFFYHIYVPYSHTDNVGAFTHDNQLYATSDAARLAMKAQYEELKSLSGYPHGEKMGLGSSIPA